MKLSSPPMGVGHSLARNASASARALPVGGMTILATGRRAALGSFPPPHAARSAPRATQVVHPRRRRREELDMGGLWETGYNPITAPQHSPPASRRQGTHGTHHQPEDRDPRAGKPGAPRAPRAGGAQGRSRGY